MDCSKRALNQFPVKQSARYACYAFVLEYFYWRMEFCKGFLLKKILFWKISKSFSFIATILYTDINVVLFPKIFSGKDIIPWHSGKVSRPSDSCVRNFLVLGFGGRTDSLGKF